MSKTAPQTIVANKTTQDQLRTYIERIERLEEEKKALGQDIGDIYREAAGNGYDKKVMRKLIALRKMDPAAAQELEDLLAIYKQAVGM